MGFYTPRRTVIEAKKKQKKQQQALEEVSDNEAHRKYLLSFWACEPLCIHRHGTGDGWHRCDSILTHEDVG